MANYRYLGYGITDENGIAHLDHDADGQAITHSYTGTGAGEIDVVASLDDSTHISDSSIQSETYEVIDAFLKDNGTTDTSIWASSTATIDRNVSNEYTHFTGTGSSNAVILVKNGVNDVFDYTKNWAIEFDGWNVNASNIYVYQGSSSKGGVNNPTSSDFVHIRLEYDATNQAIKIFKDNVQQGNTVSLNSVTTNFSIRFVDWQGDLDLKIKNFIAYSI